MCNNAYIEDISAEHVRDDRERECRRFASPPLSHVFVIFFPKKATTLVYYYCYYICSKVQENTI